jgi:membrane fusion protein (multidrug efflux system)
MLHRKWIGSVLLVLGVVATGAALAAWKQASLHDATAAASNQPEPLEAVAAAVVQERNHKRTTTAIGTVVALRSITLRNEVPGTVRHVALTPGRIVEPGTVLVALDVAVEEAELKAQQAQADLARTLLARMQRMNESGAASAIELDNARAEHDVALAQVARTKAIIARKTIRAPFRARVGISDVHPGQYLNEGSVLTTLQGVDQSAYVDFTVAQQVAAALHKNGTVDIFAGNEPRPTSAAIVAIDARVDSATRNAVVRAEVDSAAFAALPGASVRVLVPVESPRKAVAVPASALRKGPGGDHVFVLKEDESGKTRAHVRVVQVDTMAGDEVVVVKGLAAGERVAASGSFKLREAVLVAVTNAPAAVHAPAALAIDGGANGTKGSF